MTKRRRIILFVAAGALVLISVLAVVLFRVGGDLIFVQEKDAAIFGDNTVNEIAVEWSYDTLRFYGSAELIANDKEPEQRAVLAKFKDTLGYYKSGNGIVTNLRVVKDAGGDDAIVGDYINKAQFSKGVAVVEMELMKRKVGDWQVMTFEVQPLDATKKE